IGLLGVAFHVSPWSMRATGLWRAASTLTYANALGALLVLSVPAALVLAAERPGPIARVFTFLILAGVLASLSRGAFLGMAVLGGAVAVRARRSEHPIDWRRLAAAALVATLIGGGLFVFGHGSRLLARRLDPGTEKRGEILRQTLRAASVEPLFGIGPGNLRI